MPSGAIRQLLTLAAALFLFEDNKRAELVCQNFLEGNLNAKFQRRPKVECAPDEKAGLGVLGVIELIERPSSDPWPV